MSCANKVLVVTHVGKSGGAGIYISDFLKHLSAVSAVDVVGKGSADYAPKILPLSTLLNEKNFFFPHYRGTNLVHRLYWGAKLICDFLALPIYWKKSKAFFRNYDFIVVTSSIQIFLAFVFRVLGYKGKTVCLVQENLSLEGFLGFFIRYALSQFSYVFSITQSWSNYARRYSVETNFLPNTFVKPDFKASDNAEYYEVLYVGGSSKLKGFRTILDAFRVLAEKKYLKLCMLGSYDVDSIAEVERFRTELNQLGSKIELVGHTENVYQYLRLSSVLVMPIEESHFCRPAVEAGLCHRTFIVPRLDDLDDFARDNVNCLMYEPNSIDDLVGKIETLLDDVELRKKMEKANYNYSLKNFSADKFALEITKVFAPF